MLGFTLLLTLNLFSLLCMKSFFCFFSFFALTFSVSANLTNVVLVMADDQGWGQTGYYNHPVLKTPNLDAMAANGLRFDRFYAGGPVCSPTRATVLTGRTHDRTGCLLYTSPSPRDATLSRMPSSA